MSRKKGFGRVYGIQRRILLYFILLLLMVFIPIMLLAVEYTKQTSFNALQETYEYKVQTAFDSFHNYYERIDADMGMLVVNSAVQKSLKLYELSAENKEALLKVLTYMGEHSDYYLYLDNKGNTYSQKNISLDNNISKYEWVHILEGEYGKTKFSYGKDSLFGDGGKYLFASRYVRYLNYNYEPGILCLWLDKDDLDTVLGGTREDAAYYLLLDQENNVCHVKTNSTADLSDEEIGNVVKRLESLQENTDGKFTVIDHGNLYSYREDDTTGFKVAVYVPDSIALSGVRKIEIGLLAILLGVLTIAVFISNIFAGHLTIPIRKISNYMKDFDETKIGNYIDIRTSTELDTIGNSYNHMIDRVASLMEEVRHREQELRKSEMDSLIYQIQPHFLYNTLDTIYMLARMSKEKRIQDMIYALSRMLRINLSKGAEEIPVREELEHVKCYMDIQKVRNENLFDYEINCEEDAKEVQIIKLILQPLAENAIKHGFRDLREGGRIRIDVRRESDMLSICMSNNGELINREIMSYINGLVEKPVMEIADLFSQKQGGYGIGNVIKRLRLKYGEIVKFYFEVKDGQTICHIEIPLERRKKEDEKKEEKEDV